MYVTRFLNPTHANGQAFRKRCIIPRVHFVGRHHAKSLNESRAVKIKAAYARHKTNQIAYHAWSAQIGSISVTKAIAPMPFKAAQHPLPT